jgi:hypothetical protein
MEDLKVMLILKILFNLYLGSNEVLAWQKIYQRADQENCDCTPVSN